MARRRLRKRYLSRGGASYYGGRAKKRFKSTYRKTRRKVSGMKVKHKQWLTGALGVTAFFIAMPHIFSNILARVRGGA